MTSAGQSLDLILNTVSASHDLDHYLPLLANKGVLVQLGLVMTPHPVKQLPLMFRYIIHISLEISMVIGVQTDFRKLSIAGSLIGGLPETQVRLLMFFLLNYY